MASDSEGSGCGWIIGALILIFIIGGAINSDDDESRNDWSSERSIPVTRVVQNRTTTSNNTSNCDPSYPGVCIPRYSSVGDLDCKDVTYKNFRVTGDDPHYFDSDGDGYGCEPYYGH